MDATALAAENTQLKAALAAEQQKRTALEEKLEALALELAKLKRQVIGPKSERRHEEDPAQASLFATPEPAPEAPASAPAKTPPVVTPADGSINIRLRRADTQAIIEVADSGVGILPEDVSRIFDELYRGSNARGTEGSGLGLALVNRITVLHGGGVGVRSSQNEPRGTVFTIRLPRR